MLCWSWDLLAQRHKDWCLCVRSKLKVLLLGWNQSSSNTVLVGALSGCSMCGSAVSVKVAFPFTCVVVVPYGNNQQKTLCNSRQNVPIATILCILTGRSTLCQYSTMLHHHLTHFNMCGSHNFCACLFSQHSFLFATSVPVSCRLLAASAPRTWPLYLDVTGITW